MLLKLQSIISLLTCSCLICAASTPSSIGFMVTNGEAKVDGAAVQGNSTLFQGSEVTAGEITSDLRFADGSTLLLYPGAVAQVYRDHSVLQQGIASQHGANGRELVADGLKVTSLSANGTVLVGIKDASHLEAMAQGGAAEVRTPTGDLVARLEPGKQLSFAIREMNPDGAAALPPGGNGQQGGAAPAAQGPVWTKGSIVFLAVVAAGGTLLGLAASGHLGNGPSVSTP